MDPIGSDHEISRNLPLPIMTIFETQAADATVVGADQIDELRLERDRGAGLLRGIDKHSIDDSTSRRVETFHLLLRFDRHRDDLVSVVERRRSDHRRTGCCDFLQHAPARELENAGAHEGVGRHRITSVVTAVDCEHTKASSREEQRGGCAGATGPDNGDVEIGFGSDGDNISNGVWWWQVESN